MELKNLSKNITDMRGKEITIENTKISVRDVLSNIIASGFERPEAIDVANLYALANSVYNAKDTIDVSTTQVELINKCVKSNRWERVYTPYVIGQVLLLSGIESDKKDKK